MVIFLKVYTDGNYEDVVGITAGVGDRSILIVGGLSQLNTFFLSVQVKISRDSSWHN